MSVATAEVDACEECPPYHPCRRCSQKFFDAAVSLYFWVDGFIADQPAPRTPTDAG